MVEELYGSARYFFLFIVPARRVIWSARLLVITVSAASGSLLDLSVSCSPPPRQESPDSAKFVYGSALIRWLVYIAVFGLIMAVRTTSLTRRAAAGYLLGRVMADRQPSDVNEASAPMCLAGLQVSPYR